MLARTSRSRTDGGFTLVEPMVVVLMVVVLMVVVLIIGVLLAIAIPTFIGARHRAQDAVARSSLRLGLGRSITMVGSTERAELWRLNHSWGLPLGPNGSTSCDCNACVRHGENKLFFDRGAAESCRSHLGCRCLAEPIEMRVDLHALRRLSVDDRSVDLRHRDVAALLNGERGLV